MIRSLKNAKVLPILVRRCSLRRKNVQLQNNHQKKFLIIDKLKSFYARKKIVITIRDRFDKMRWTKHSNNLSLLNHPFYHCLLPLFDLLWVKYACVCLWMIPIKKINTSKKIKPVWVPFIWRWFTDRKHWNIRIEK